MEICTPGKTVISNYSTIKYRNVRQWFITYFVCCYKQINKNQNMLSTVVALLNQRLYFKQSTNQNIGCI